MMAAMVMLFLVALAMKGVVGGGLPVRGTRHHRTLQAPMAHHTAGHTGMVVLTAATVMLVGAGGREIIFADLGASADTTR